MCGIALLIGEHELWPELEQGALAGGSYALIGRERGSSNAFGDVRFAVGISALGEPGMRQPHTHALLPGCYLAWNGGVFESDAELQMLMQDEDDGAALMKQLARASVQSAGDTTANALADTLARIEGPYAFVLLDVTIVLTRPFMVAFFSGATRWGAGRSCTRKRESVSCLLEHGAQTKLSRSAKLTVRAFGRWIL